MVIVWSEKCTVYGNVIDKLISGATRILKLAFEIWIICMIA